MFVTQLVCDFCGKPFRNHKRCYDNSKEVTVMGLARTKEWNTKELFPHLCQSCANKLDLALAACKNGMTVQALLTEQYRKINDARREELGSNG